MNALMHLWDRIASAVLTVNPGQWDDVHDIFPDED